MLRDIGFLREDFDHIKQMRISNDVLNRSSIVGLEFGSGFSLCRCYIVFECHGNETISVHYMITTERDRRNPKLGVLLAAFLLAAPTGR